ncbi:DUF3991 domain-containing protein [Telluribacter humicola]|uniref:DUF3991 domain-containing protein n=1 Tax=Telluribacter humicola TaxID=1720261 RepID=UPI001A970EAC|nr:DUF3991 domain-containing protein [Telluribacter humicola]
MNQPINFLDPDRLELFQQFHAHQVQYLAFGSFSINAYEQARTDSTIKLWVDTQGSNLQRLNQALQGAGRAVMAADFDPEQKKPLAPTNGIATRDTLSVEFYPTINGFKGTDFTQAYGRRVDIATLEAPDHTQDKVVRLSHLSLSDLYHNVGHTRGKAKEYNLAVLYQAAKVFPFSGPPLAEPSTYLTMEKQNTLKIASKPAPRPNTKTPLYEKRDFTQIRNELDMEVVLQHYGYQLSSKSKPNDLWRVYKSGITGDSQRFAVMTNSRSGFKGFVDLNNNALKGDVVGFIKYKEGDYRRVFQVVDELLGNPSYRERVTQVPPMAVATPRQYLNDQKLRQSDLLETYSVTLYSPQQSDYLTRSRMLAPETVQAPEFQHQVLTVQKGSHVNVAFPLRSEKGNILSMDIRNDDFKSFPPGNKGDAIWKSNGHAQLLHGMEYHLGDKLVPLERGTKGTVSGTGSSQIFHTDHPVEGVLSVPVEKGSLSPIPTNRIIISESPIDSLSYHKLSPPQAGEYRQYISPAGNPSKEQLGHIARFVQEHPKAQFVIGMDGNPPGHRFAINLLATKHHLRNDSYAIHPQVVYNNPTPVPGEGKDVTDIKEVGFNLLTLQIKHPLSSSVSFEKARAQNEEVLGRLLDKVNLYQPPGKLATETRRENFVVVETGTLRTESEIRFPNQSKLLERVLDQLAEEITRRDGQRLTAVLRPTAVQNDFNDVLRSRNGQSLPESSNLSLSGVPLEPYQRVENSHAQTECKQEKNHPEPGKVESVPKNRGMRI